MLRFSSLLSLILFSLKPFFLMNFFFLISSSILSFVSLTLCVYRIFKYSILALHLSFLDSSSSPFFLNFFLFIFLSYFLFLIPFFYFLFAASSESEIFCLWAVKRSVSNGRIGNKSPSFTFSVPFELQFFFRVLFRLLCFLLLNYLTFLFDLPGACVFFFNALLCPLHRCSLFLLFRYCLLL